MEQQLTRSVAAPMGGRGLRTDGGAYEFWPRQDEVSQARVVNVVGIANVAFGAWQLLAPGQFSHTVGMRYPNWLLRLAGARALAQGLGILTRPESRNWRRIRVLSGMVHVGLIGAAAFSPRADRRRLAALAALAAGMIALDARAARAGSTAPRRA